MSTEELDDDDHDDSDNSQSYLFPNPELKSKPSESLEALIAALLDDTIDRTDGTDMHSDVRIDYAQDLIEQARDILVERGYVFGAEQRLTLPFLSWPLTQEQQAEADREKADADAEKARMLVEWEKAQQEMRRIVSALIAGEKLPGIDVGLIELRIGDSTIGSGLGPSGAQVLAMAEAIKRIIGQKPQITYCCSKAGITFAEDKAPAWGLQFRLTRQRELWALITKWIQGRQFHIDAIATDYGPHPWAGPIPAWVCVYDLFDPDLPESLALHLLGYTNPAF